MTRIVRRPVMVLLDADGHILGFRDGVRVYRVQAVIDQWREMGAWWNGEPERRVIRVETADHGVYDLEHQGGAWYIYRVWD
jgi:hypothetical protein